MNARTRLALLLVVLSMALGACTSTHYVSIRHPLHVGQVDPNSVPFEAVRDERPRGLPPGTLTDEAILTEVTPERVCVQLSMWQLDEVDAGRGQYENYTIALLNDQDGLENNAAQVQPGPPQTQAYQGHIAQRVPAGWRNVCVTYSNRVCVRYRREQVYRTVYVPHVWQVSNFPANVCFPNGGFVTPSTTRVALEVDGQGPGRQVFEWQFESAVAGGQPQQQ